MDITPIAKVLGEIHFGRLRFLISVNPLPRGRPMAPLLRLRYDFLTRVYILVTNNGGYRDGDFAGFLALLQRYQAHSECRNLPTSVAL